MNPVAGSRRANKILRGNKADRERMRLNDIQAVMSTVEGRRFVFDLLDSRCRMFSASYTATNETVYNEGKRAVGITLSLELQDRFPQMYTQMLSEAFDLKSHDRLVEQAADNAAQTEEP